MIKLPDPELCARCFDRGKVIESRPRNGYRRRRHECRVCGARWTSYQTRINPRRLRARVTAKVTNATG